MSSICLYFNIHQPVRLRKFGFFDMGKSDYYYDDYSNEIILKQVVENCYLPTNKMLLDLINIHQGRFKVAFSISGTAIDQFKIYAPQVIESFRELADTGCVEFMAETYCHSLSFLKNEVEFKRQVELHATTIETIFGKRPTIFANTELIYSDQIGALVANMGFKAMLAEGPSHILKWRSPNYLYRNAIDSELIVLLKNNQLSDDIASRFSNSNWSGWPLTVPKYVSWLNKISKKEKIVNLFMNYEIFGEHQKSRTGIFEFLNSLPAEVYRKTDFEFLTPSEIVAKYQPVSTLNVNYPISLTDQAVDLTPWLGNELQQEAFEKLYNLSDLVHQCSDPDILKDWQYLQTSDHFYYMSTKSFPEGEVHTCFNPYNGPYEAFMNFMNVLNDFSIRLNQKVESKYSDQFNMKEIELEVL